MSKQQQKKRNQFKEARLEIVAQMYKRGNSVRKIRDEVMRRLDLQKYSTSTVHSDIQTLLQEWRENRYKDIDDALTRRFRSFGISGKSRKRTIFRPPAPAEAPLSGMRTTGMVRIRTTANSPLSVRTSARSALSARRKRLSASVTRPISQRFASS